MKKTIKIDELKQMANEILKNSHNDEKQFRTGVILLLEQTLLKTGNYNGFQYLDSKELPYGSLPGIREYNESKKEWNFNDTDHTRVKYY